MSESKLHLVQLSGPEGRRVAVVEEPELRLLDSPLSIYELAVQALREEVPISELVGRSASDRRLGYDEVYDGKSEWRLLPAIDVPGRPELVLVSGTGLTHYGSARDRQNMHQVVTAEQEAAMTDSMRMFRWTASCASMLLFIAGASRTGACVARYNELRKSSAIPWANLPITFAVQGATSSSAMESAIAMCSMSALAPGFHCDVMTGRLVIASKVSGAMNFVAARVITATTS